MIPSLSRTDWTRWKPSPVSRQKKDALFELACRIALIAEKARQGDHAALAAAAAAERRKALRFGLELLAEGAEAEALDQAYDLDPSFRDLEAADSLELALTRKGLFSIAAREHPFVALRRTSALLGLEYLEKSEAWMQAAIKKRKRRNQPLLVPGDLPDLVRTLAVDGSSLERALRAGGRSLSAAALAGCPQESLDLACPAFGPVGGAILADDAFYLRGKLSGDEIAQAQSAILDVVHSLEEGGEVELSEEEELYGDPAFVGELSRIVLSAEEKPLKAYCKALDARLLAMAMQGMEPSAHEQILGLLTKKEENRVLDAIDAMILLPRREIEDAGRAFAGGLLSNLEKLHLASGESAARLARVRDWPEAGSHHL